MFLTLINITQSLLQQAEYFRDVEEGEIPIVGGLVVNMDRFPVFSISNDDKYVYNEEIHNLYQINQGDEIAGHVEREER
jgi:hypothetical protein